MIRSVESLTTLAASHGSAQLDELAQRAGNLVYMLSDAAAAVQSTSDTAGGAAKDDGGFFGPLASLFESILKVLQQGIDSVGVPYSYGFAIVLLTLLVKAATFPLTQKQVQSTMAMQTLQPRIKEIQERYKGKDQQEMQIQVGQLYKDAGVNPLAGCLPTLATLPVWIGLYRALSNVADEGLLTAGFFWIPSLAGPTSLAAQKAGAGSWLLPFKDGQPPLGWQDTIAYLILPVLLVVSQFVSQKIMTPKTDDPQQQQTQKYLQFLPLLIGYFSLNVPSGLTLYWFVNNLLSTAQQVYLKNANPAPALSSSGGASTSSSSNGAWQPGTEGTIIKPDKQAAKTQRRQQAPVETRAQAPSQQDSSKARAGERFRALRAKEAAKKAARLSAQAVASATGNNAEDAGREADVALESESSPVRTTAEDKKA